LYDQLGKPSAALAYADKALAVVPASDKSSMEALRRQLADRASSGG
jgi:hypothetical protein